MSKKNYWKVEHGGIYAVLTCPLCNVWFDIPNAPGNAESYHFCPGCSKPMEVHPDDRYVKGSQCSPDCTHLISRQEEYDDEPMGYCDAHNGKFVDSMDEIREGKCECVEPEQKTINIKVVLENGCLESVLKDTDRSINVEVISIDKDYADCKQLKKYRDALYHNPADKDCDCKATCFDSDL